VKFRKCLIHMMNLGRLTRAWMLWATDTGRGRLVALRGLRLRFRFASLMCSSVARLRTAN